MIDPSAIEEGLVVVMFLLRDLPNRSRVMFYFGADLFTQLHF
jgi:hypothetical protein